MAEEGIRVDGFFESHYYYKAGRSINGKRVFLYDSREIPCKRYNLILGASGKGIYDVIKNEKYVGNDIYALDTGTPLFEISYEWVETHVDELNKIYSLLEDELSRETFLSFINDKVNCINLDTQPLWKLWSSDQYFNELYDFNRFSTHALVDCGAWVGDTAEEYLDFLNKAGRNGLVYAFEPDSENFRRLKQTSRDRGYIDCYPFAVGNENKEVLFCSGISSQSHLAEGEQGIKVTMVKGDDVLKGKEISMIKMDLEGGEEEALKGLIKTIERNSPILSVCVYHKVDDLLRIPKLIITIAETAGINYKYYLRHHSSTSSETVLYAVP